jgi:hypothetical protein
MLRHSIKCAWIAHICPHNHTTAHERLIHLLVEVLQSQLSLVKLSFAEKWVWVIQTEVWIASIQMTVHSHCTEVLSLE